MTDRVLATGFAEVSLRVIAIVALALATTAVSLRLLGTQRGWVPLGYGGLFAGSVLLLRVVSGVARDGT